MDKAGSCEVVDKNELRQFQRLTNAWSRPVFNLVLYLCSENSDIANDGSNVRDPIQKITKRGVHLPPSLPTEWEVGVGIGAALLAAKQGSPASSCGSATRKRAHIRRAHWHGIRVGPIRCADGTAIATHVRRFELRWLRSIFVNVDCVDELPATIRPVE